MRNRILCGVAICAALFGSGTAGAQTPTVERLTAPFSDPARPGTVKVSLLSGDITVRVGSGRDVIVTPTASNDRDREREREREKAKSQDANRDDPSTAELRRLTPPRGVRIEEENNVMTIAGPLAGADLEIQVPVATSLVLRAVNGGDIVVEGVNGSIEVSIVNGSIRLSDVSGAVSAHATNGKIVAALRQVSAGKPMSFTSFNGAVDVTLPSSVKANVKLRSDRGDVYTDFDVQTVARPTAQPSAVPPPGARDRERQRTDDRGRYRIELDRSIYGTINGGGPDFELRTFNGNVYLRKAK